MSIENPFAPKTPEGHQVTEDSVNGQAIEIAEAQGNLPEGQIATIDLGALDTWQKTIESALKETSE